MKIRDNCVSGYLNQVLNGHVYIYKVWSPERATLSLVRSHAGWKLGELSGICNQSVSESTRHEVNKWLSPPREINYDEIDCDIPF